MMPTSAASTAAPTISSQIETWMPGTVDVDPTSPKWNVTCENCWVANQPATYAPTA